MVDGEVWDWSASFAFAARVARREGTFARMKMRLLASVSGRALRRLPLGVAVAFLSLPAAAVEGPVSSQPAGVSGPPALVAAASPDAVAAASPAAGAETKPDDGQAEEGQ